MPDCRSWAVWIHPTFDTRQPASKLKTWEWAVTPIQMGEHFLLAVRFQHQLH